MKKYIITLITICGIALSGHAFAQSNGDILAGSGIVVKQETEAGYRLNDYILRQEVVGMAAKLNGLTLPENYACKGYFTDVTATKPNNWICRVSETAADAGLVTKTNKTFRPEDRITKAEALGMIMNAAKLNTGSTSTASSFNDVTIPWQINITDKALTQDIIDWGSTFSPNKDATRGEVFDMAARIIKNEAKNTSGGDMDYQDILDIIGQ